MKASLIFILLNIEALSIFVFDFNAVTFSSSLKGLFLAYGSLAGVRLVCDC